MAGAGLHDGGRVDALYIFLLIVTGMMALLYFVCLVFFAARFRHRPGVRAEQIEGSTPLEITWSVIPFLIFMVIFAWGAVGLLQRAHASLGRDRSLCCGKTMDVEARTRGRPARNQRTARPRRTRRETDHDLAGCDSQFLHSGVPHQAGRAAWPLHRGMVPRH